MFMSDNGAEASRRDLVPPISEHVGNEYDHSLENLGSANTYVMYGSNWANASSSPHFRRKATAFEGGIKVPAFAHFPRLIAPGTTYRGSVVVPIQGRSLLPMLAGETGEVHPPDTVLGWELLGQRAVRQGQWKIVCDQRLPPAQRRWQLFDLAADPFEQHDLSSSNPERLATMERLWERLRRGERGRVLTGLSGGRRAARRTAAAPRRRGRSSAHRRAANA